MSRLFDIAPFRVVIAMALLSLSSVKAPATTKASPPPRQSSVTFRWDSPRDPSVVSYKIYWGTGRGNYQHVREIKRDMKATPRAQLTLQLNMTYYVAVSACNNVGESRLSNEVIVPPAGQGHG